MKTIYSLQEFRNEVLKIAATQDETYTSIVVELDHNGKVKFKAYIPNLSWQEGDTMEDCLMALKEQIVPPVIPSIDVEIEMPEPTEEKESEAEVVSTTTTDDLPF